MRCINFGFVGSTMPGLLAGALIGLINGFMIGKMEAQRHHLDTGGKSFDIRCQYELVWQGKMLYAEDIAKESMQSSAKSFTRFTEPISVEQSP